MYNSGPWWAQDVSNKWFISRNYILPGVKLRPRKFGGFISI